MAFNVQNFLRTSAGEFGSSQCPVDFKYNGKAAGDTKAAILAADYFLSENANLSVGSLLSFTASDATLVLAMVTASSTSTVTISEITETLPPGSVDTADLADGCVTTAKLADGAVTTVKLADANVTTAKIADANVTTAKIADANVTGAKLAAGAAAGNITAGEITNTMLADGAVSGAKIAALGVAAGKYAAASIATADIALLAVGNAQMAAGAALANLAPASVTADKMAAGVLPINNQVHTTVAGATNTITIAGVVATDVVQATINTVGASPVTIVSAAAGAGNVAVTFSADPSTDHRVNISVFRP